MINSIIKYVVLNISFILALSFISCQKNKRNELDITEIIEKAHVIADNYFSEDLYGTPYNKNKPWLVYNKFINNDDLKAGLKIIAIVKDSSEHTKSSFCSLKDTLYIKEMGRAKLIYDYKSIYNKENDFYLVRLNQPMKNNKEVYWTQIWINANKWRSGFHIYVEFKIEEGKAKVIKISNDTRENVFESSNH